MDRLNRPRQGSIVVREHRGQPFYEAKFRHGGRQVKRRIGPAWLDRDSAAGWRRRRGRLPDDFYDERRAHVAAARLMCAYLEEAADRERVGRERRERGVTFAEVAREYLKWLAEVRGAKPSTMRDYRYMLAPHGKIMAAIGARPAARVGVREIEALLASVGDGGASPRTVNKHRALVAAIYGYGTRGSTFALPANPARAADKRREPHRGVLLYFTPEEIEALARAFEDGRHRDQRHPAVADDGRVARQAEDHRDAELVRVAAYAGLRQGELMALRWRDVDFAGSAITVARAFSAGLETSTKSGRVRRVPLPDQAAAALDRLSRRADFTGRDELVFCNVFGRALDDSALRRRFKRARDAAGLRPLRFHDLRHTYGSLLAAGGVDLVAIQAAMGHAALVTTGRYLHARPASDQAAIFTRAFLPTDPLRELAGSAGAREPGPEK
ncbi:MAG: tyrosine-type recombinase/integrase [Solirubrobacteraceae bacterium]